MPGIAELIGYVASTLIVVSLMMTSLLRLRLVNLVGSVTFGIYAVLIGSVPVLVTNVAITVINVHQLWRLQRDRVHDAYFEVVEVDPGSAVLDRFVAFHAHDIARFQPSFDGLRPDHLTWMVLRDALPVGAVAARRTGETSAELVLDYVAPEHRDFRAGSVLFGESSAFRQRGITTLTTRASTSVHRRYLERMGFHGDGDVWSRGVS
jgi:hypothetical protein